MDKQSPLLFVHRTYKQPKMFFEKIKIAFYCCLLALFIVSCSKEDNIVTQNLTDETESQEANRGNQSQGNNDNRPNNENDENERQVNRIDSEIMVEWTNLFLELERYAGGMRPNASARAIAYINLAAYETVVPGMPAFFSNSGRLPDLNIRRNAPRNINWEAALNACYADVLAHFLLNVPNNLARRINQLENNLEREIGNRQDVRASRDWGAYIANVIIEYSQTDSEAEQQVLEPQPLSYEPPVGDGYWTYSAEPERALFPYWEKVRTFTVTPDETSTIPPLSYSTDPGSPYYQEMMEVYESNNQAREEDGEALWIAEFWSDDVETLMFSPPARQVSIASQLIVDHDLNLARAVHLMLKLGFSLNDAAVSTWKYKYEYMVMRPSVYIQEFIDPSYQTNLFRLIPWPNPTFPGYPSGHSCFASAAAGVFIDFFGNNINFTDRSHEGRTEFRGNPRTFTSFNQLAAENGYSRIPLGVHIRIDCTEGLRLGYEIADFVNNYDLRRPDL